MRTIVWPVVFGVVLVAAVGAVNTTRADDAKIDEQDVGPINQDAKYVLSPHGMHLASVSAKGSRLAVVVDGVAGPKFDQIVTPSVAYIDPRPATAAGQGSIAGPVTFSKDGKRFAYLGRQSQEWVLMADNKEILRLPAGGTVGGITGIGGSAGNTDVRMEFTGDAGQHLLLAKSALTGGFELWVDGQKMPGAYNSAGSGTASLDPLVSPDAQHIAYIAQIGRDKQTLIVDGKDAGYVAEQLQYTSDSQHLLGLVRSPKGDTVLMDGKPLYTSREIQQLFVAPVGNRTLVVASHFGANGNSRDGQMLLVDGKPVEASICEQIKKVIFSPDGKRYAATCGRPGMEFVLTDGKKGQEYQFIDQDLTGLSVGLQFSGDSTKVGYIGNANNKKFIVINDDESDAFDAGGGLLFSPDSKHVVMYGSQGQTWPVYIDGKAEQFGKGFNPQSFAFSADGSRHGYCSGGGPAGAGVYIDGKETGYTGQFSFSPDGKHVMIVGFHAADGKAGLFVDGQLISPTDRESRARFHSFTPDSQHAFWISLEPATGPNATPGTWEHVTYLDGKAVAHCDRIDSGPIAPLYGRNGKIDLADATCPAWDVGADGALTFLAPSGNTIKRFTVTPSSDTNLATMLTGAPAKSGTQAPAGTPAQGGHPASTASKSAANSGAAKGRAQGTTAQTNPFERAMAMASTLNANTNAVQTAANTTTNKIDEALDKTKKAVDSTKSAADAFKHLFGN